MIPPADHQPTVRLVNLGPYRESYTRTAIAAGTMVTRIDLGPQVEKSSDPEFAELHSHLNPEAGQPAHCHGTELLSSDKVAASNRSENRTVTLWGCNLSTSESEQYAHSSMRFTENANAAVFAVARLRPDGDLHVLAERDQKTHQALAGKIGEAPIDQRRHLGLVDAHERGRYDLSQSPALDHAPDMARELRLGQLFFSVGQPHVGKDISAALGHWDFCFSLFDHRS